MAPQTPTAADIESAVEQLDLIGLNIHKNADGWACWTRKRGSEGWSCSVHHDDLGSAIAEALGIAAATEKEEEDWEMLI